MARLFADEDFPVPVVERLRKLGHDVMTVRQAGLDNLGTTDSAILMRAASDGRAVLTMNRRDFIALHLADSSHSGIVVCTRDDDVEALSKRIDAAVAPFPSLLGLLLRVNRPSRTN